MLVEEFFSGPEHYELTALFDSLTISGQLRPWCIARLLWNEFNLCLRSNRFPCWLGAMRSNRMFPCGPDQYVNQSVPFFPLQLTHAKGALVGASSLCANYGVTLSVAAPTPATAPAETTSAPEVTAPPTTTEAATASSNATASLSTFTGAAPQAEFFVSGAFLAGAGFLLALF